MTQAPVFARFDSTVGRLPRLTAGGPPLSGAPRAPAEEPAMKVHDFAYQVAMRTIELMEQNQHYKVSEEHRKEIGKQILEEVTSILKKSS